MTLPDEDESFRQCAWMKSFRNARRGQICDRRLLWQTLARTSFKEGCLTFDGIQLLSKYSGAPFICIAKQSVENGVSRNRTVLIVRHSPLYVVNALLL